MIRHLKQYHADKRMFKCLICSKDYKWIDSLHKHMKIHKQQQQQQQLSQQPTSQQQSEAMLIDVPLITEQSQTVAE